MTGYTVNTGSTAKFSEGWDRIFGGTLDKSSKNSAKKSTTGKPLSTKTGVKTEKGKKSAAVNMATAKRPTAKRKKA